MKPISALACVTGALLVATPAAATPPDVIDISDQLFALSNDAVFVLRSSTDNLGVYYSSYRETWLVGIDVATGEETAWLVYRGRRDTVFGDDGTDESLAVTLIDRESWHDPMQVIADAQAERVLGEGRGRRDGEALIPDASGQFAVELDYWPRFAWQRRAALDRARASVATLAANVAETDRLAPVTTRELFAMREVEWDSCAFHQHGYPRGTAANAYLLVRVDCEGVDNGETTSLIQVVSPSSAG
ncbi:hypothetical protein [Aurantiacibacter gilvus]|uniref:Uncharacterized protein n=1 Tax=Aurantiacibacter gilvus TaxID=3139141 RepID=A0ABU9II28_9SPHN